MPQSPGATSYGPHLFGVRLADHISSVSGLVDPNIHAYGHILGLLESDLKFKNEQILWLSGSFDVSSHISDLDRCFSAGFCAAVDGFIYKIMAFRALRRESDLELINAAIAELRETSLDMQEHQYENGQYNAKFSFGSASGILMLGPQYCSMHLFADPSITPRFSKRGFFSSLFN